MKIIGILSLILACNVSNAQDRIDTIRMKDGTVIVCQILKVSEPDSVIQFCIKEHGQLKLKKIQTTFVDSYAWPGKEKAEKYSKMLSVKTLQDGEVYKSYWLIKPSLQLLEPTCDERAEKELKKARLSLNASLLVSSAGLVTAIIVPKMIIKYNSKSILNYDDAVHLAHIVGYGVVVFGAGIGISALSHVIKASKIYQECNNKLSFIVNSNGLSLAYRF